MPALPHCKTLFNWFHLHYDFYFHIHSQYFNSRFQKQISFPLLIFLFFFLIFSEIFTVFWTGVFFHGHWQLTEQQEKGGDLFYSTLPLPPAHEHSDIYVQLCTWDDYHIFLIATLVFTRLLLDEIYHLIELLFDWLMMWCWFSFVCLLIWF